MKTKEDLLQEIEKLRIKAERLENDKISQTVRSPKFLYCTSINASGKIVKYEIINIKNTEIEKKYKYKNCYDLIDKELDIYVNNDYLNGLKDGFDAARELNE